MKAYFAIPLAIIGLAVALAIVGPLNERWSDANAYRRQADAIALEHQQTQLQDWQAQQQATFMSRAAASNLGYLGAGLASVLLLMFLVDFYRQRRAPLVRVDGVPLARRLAEDGELIALLADKIRAAGVAQIETAIHQPGQTPHVFSPHYTQRQTDIALPELAAGQLTIASVPSFAQLLDEGKIGLTADGRAQPLILGYSDQGAIEGSWRSLYSSSSGGLQGSGKTWGAAFLLAQSAAAGAKLMGVFA